MYAATGDDHGDAVGAYSYAFNIVPMRRVPTVTKRYR